MIIGTTWLLLQIGGPFCKWPLLGSSLGNSHTGLDNLKNHLEVDLRYMIPSS